MKLESEVRGKLRQIQATIRRNKKMMKEGKNPIKGLGCGIQNWVLQWKAETLKWVLNQKNAPKDLLP